MTHHSKDVEVEYKRLHPERSDVQRGRDVNERCRIARQKWDAIDVEEQREWEAGAEAEYREMVDHYKTVKGTVTGTLEQTAENRAR